MRALPFAAGWRFDLRLRAYAMAECRAAIAEPLTHLSIPLPLATRFPTSAVLNSAAALGRGRA